jgi:5-formyltetrahydrofolate cyclo-ligase
MNLPSKADLRRSLLQTRRSLPPQVWRQQSDRLCHHLQQSLLFTQAKTILAYWSFRQEPDLSGLWTSPRRWGLPRCVGKSIVWHLWSAADPLQTGAYGIQEPHPDAPTLDPSEVDLILVPAVACDRQGYRLGYGGGFYDRLLATSEWATIPTIGIIFEFAHLAQLPIDAWDLPLQAVCTEAGFSLTGRFPR